MNELFDSGWAKFWLDAAQTIVLLVLAGYEFITRRTTANRKQIDDQAERVDELEKDLVKQMNDLGQAIRRDFEAALAKRDETFRQALQDIVKENKEDRMSLYRRAEEASTRIERLEGVMNGLPTQSDIRRLADQIQKLHADMGRLTGLVSGLEHLAKLGNEFLLTQGNRGGQQ